ncbi:MAG TPA: hypothetical protein VM432_11915 [Bdellovibrionales bacterium]|nr:hypothetical protein [Bdellovibrionales bacterium]
MVSRSARLVIIIALLALIAPLFAKADQAVPMYAVVEELNGTRCEILEIRDALANRRFGSSIEDLKTKPASLANRLHYVFVKHDLMQFAKTQMGREMILSDYEQATSNLRAITRSLNRSWMVEIDLPEINPALEVAESHLTTLIQNIGGETVACSQK